MPTVRMIEYDQADADVRAIYDDIMATKRIERVPDFWRTLAVYPPLLRRTWYDLKEIMQPGRLDRLTKEMVALAVSATNGCDYCINSHTAAAQALGMDNEMLGELMSVVGMFNETNRLAEAFQVAPDVLPLLD